MIFLVTRHRKTDVAGFAAFIAWINDNNSTLVQYLNPSDEKLVASSHDFALGYWNLSIEYLFKTVPIKSQGAHSKVHVDKYPNFKFPYLHKTHDNEITFSNTQKKPYDVCWRQSFQT